MPTTFNASVQAFEYQQPQMDSLAEVLLQNCGALTLFQQGKPVSYLEKNVIFMSVSQGK